MAPERSDRAGGSEREDARALWRCLEPVHAVTYFAPECRRHLDAVGMRGFWMGYFGARAAPLGSVGPGAVSAMFFNFRPSMVRRAIPDAWGYASPSSILQARGLGAADALTRIVPDVGKQAQSLVPLLQRMIDRADGSGRPLFSANRDLERSEDPVEALWQACTALREHRGDGHVAALTASGLDGCEALVLFARSERVPDAVFRDSRGWSTDEWEEARCRLGRRGLLGGQAITAAGSALRRSIEELTDDLAAVALSVLGADERSALLQGLGSVAASVVGADVVPFPNPIGLPAPERTRP
jgi:hypothetical protein